MSSLVGKSSNISYEVLEDQSMILYNEVTGDTHFLNAIAGLIFRLCENEPESEIFSNFMKHFSVSAESSEEDIKNDFDETVKDLVNKDVLTICESVKK